MMEKALLCALMLTAGYCDLRYRQLPNWLLLLAVWPVWQSLQRGGIGGLACGITIALLSHLPAYLKGWLGGGDLKFALAFGLIFGDAFFKVLLLAALVSGLWGALLLFFRRGRAGVWDFLGFFNSGKPHTNLAFPYGVALVVGAGLVLWQGGI